MLVAAVRPAPPLAPAAAREPTVLVVDDEPDIAESLREVVAADLAGVRVITASSADEALARLSEGIDVLVTDYKMPGHDGLWLLEQAREVAPNLPRLLMTAFPDLQLALEALERGRIEGFFVKPLDPEQVVAALDNLLKERKEAAASGQRLAAALARGVA